MKIVAQVSLAAALAGSLALAAPAHAQFGPSTPLQYLTIAAPGAPGRNRSTTLVAYPLAHFIARGTESGGTGTSTQSNTGALIAVEVGFVPDPDRFSAYALGGWYWSDYDFDNDLYELHGKYFFSQQLGIQAGFLGTTKGSGNAYDVFLLYNLSKRSPGTAPQNAVDVQLGAGVFFDASGGRTTSDFSGFVQVSKPLSEKTSIDGSYWYVRDRGIDFHRLAVGVGFKF